MQTEAELEGARAHVAELEEELAIYKEIADAEQPDAVDRLESQVPGGPTGSGIGGFSRMVERIRVICERARPVCRFVSCMRRGS